MLVTKKAYTVHDPAHVGGGPMVVISRATPARQLPEGVLAQLCTDHFVDDGTVGAGPEPIVPPPFTGGTDVAVGDIIELEG